MNETEQEKCCETCKYREIASGSPPYLCENRKSPLYGSYRSDKWLCIYWEKLENKLKPEQQESVERNKRPCFLFCQEPAECFDDIGKGQERKCVECFRLQDKLRQSIERDTIQDIREFIKINSQQCGGQQEIQYKILNDYLKQKLKEIKK